MFKRMSVVFVVALLALVSPSFVFAGSKYKKEYKMSVVVGPKLPWGAGATHFADLVRERTDGRINIKVYTSSSLMAGKQTNEFLIHRQGVAEFCFASTINWSTTIKPLNVFNLPFFFPDYKALDAVIQGEVGKELGEELKSKGVTVLAWGENGFREITNSKRAITQPQDLEGMKVRVVGTPIFIDTMKALGANPVNMNWGDAQVAFQQGVVDGQENPVVAIEIPVKIWQFHKYATIWRYVIDPLMLTVNNKTMASFTPEDQEIIRQAAIEAAEQQRGIVRKGLIAPDLSALETLRANGMEVTELDNAARAEFRAKTASVYDKWTKVIGEDLVNKAAAAIDAAN
ncbi:DctP family TRAP transporter solute-binding subunit [Desulfosediminicola flagellatus]|uniref:DctP family TRAP transporter solute-binding subunit n=1 Tax=Desulfosediminicola flagellatus TaxID=2569541 RepID=UPI001C3C8457|nr:DctP family TRAP transporter solute-binding subunit [Desulfosediminicola flagellatus]